MNREITRGIQILTDDGPVEFLKSTGAYAFGKIPSEYKLPIISSYNEKKNLVKYGKTPQIGQIIWIDPNEVNYVTPVSSQTDVNNSDPETVSNCIFDIPYGYFEPEWRVGTVRPGQWDRKEIAFENLFIYRSFRDHFIHDVPWEDTVYIDRLEEFFNNRKSLKNKRSVKEFKQDQLSFYDDLYERVEKGMYQKQSNLPEGNIFNEITVNIGRNGEIYFNSGGAHRLSIAKIADVDSIPVLPIVHHKSYLFSHN